MIRIAFESTLRVDDLKYYDSDAYFMAFLTSSATIKNLEISDSTSLSTNGMLLFDKNLELAFENWNIHNVSDSRSEFLIRISSSVVSNISNMTIQDIAQSPLRMYKDNITSIDDLTMTNCSRGMVLEQSNLDSMADSNFTNLGSNSSILNGGAILLTNSNATVSNSNFKSNQANKGGAIYFQCSTNMVCTSTISESTFDSNKANDLGGAVGYNLFRPTFQSDSFVNNSASYGNDIGSYAIEIQLKDSREDKLRLTNVGSGVKYETPFTLALYDHDGQIINTDNASQLKITGVSDGSAALGTNAVRVIEGEAIFDNIIFSSKPGAQDIIFQVTSTAVDLSKLKIVYGSDYTTGKIEVDFRYCKPGEQIATGGNTCSTCTPGTYSLFWKAESCTSCVNFAECNGGAEIKVNPGYWRRTTNSTMIIECPNDDACEGGYEPELEFPVNWADGYEGYLCSGWVSDDVERFEQVDDFVWARWPQPVLNALKVLGLFLAVVVFLVALITVNIKKREVSQKSVLMRILTNHLQMITLTFAYNLQFPNFLMDMISPLSRANSSSESVVSFDCFASESQLKVFTPSVAVLKVLISAVSPIILMLFAVILFSLCHLILPKYFKDFKRNLVISFITIIFLLHPTITTSALGIFQCIEVDEGISRVRIDLDIG